jgi:hypothetical protein
MYKLTEESLTTFEKWSSPTFQDVTNVFNKLNLSDEEIVLFLGLNIRTIRRWTSKKSNNRLEKSSIPYGIWCVLIALSENRLIFSNVQKRDITRIPKEYICSLVDFESPTKEILLSFVGKGSITGLHRKELANIFGWNPAYLGREFNKGNINFLNWVLLLLLCGVSIEKLIKIKNTK